MKTTIQTYHDMIYDSRPVKFTEFMSDKYDNIHRELFVDANNKAIKAYIDYVKENRSLIDSRYVFNSVDDFKEKVNVIELKETEYWKPSFVLWRTKIFPYRVISLVESGKEGKFSSKYHRGKMSLAPWWNMYQKFEDKDIANIQLGGEQVNDFRVISLNYVQGTAQLISKTTDKIITVPFEYLNENTEIDDSMLLSHTFTSMLNSNN